MMNTQLTNDTKTTILLCGVFGKERSVKPLTLREYNLLVKWLMKTGERPDFLLEGDSLVEASKDTGLEYSRLKSLLARGVQLGFTIEEWHRNGIWVLSRSDKDYPARYRKKLKDSAPPILFGVGDRSLLDVGGLAVVGSRNVDYKGEEFTRDVAERCVKDGIAIISGGARGVDQTSMSSALECGGSVIGVLADSLQKKSLERKSRIAIQENRLVLISPFNPNARFTVGTAMARNKLIYGLADYGLVVSAEYKKGGTWSGATEELKRENSIPVFVQKATPDIEGNSKLVLEGAYEWPDNLSSDQLTSQLKMIVGAGKKMPPPQTLDMFDTSDLNKTESDRSATFQKISDSSPALQKSTKEFQKSAFELVLPLILSKLSSPKDVETLSEELDIEKSQLRIWLAKAAEEGDVIKHSRPERYSRT
jgi:predicted Rossmann fold nucleotide-binding protein DprA/Smf involved in DNA uptake